MGNRRRTICELLALAAVWSGCGIASDDNTSVTVQEERAAAGGQVGIDLLITDGARAVPCNQGVLRASLSASQTGESGPFTPIDRSNVVVQCSTGAADVAVVVDASGSQKSKVEELKAGAGQLFDSVLSAGGRGSFVRASTQSTVVQSLTDDQALLSTAVDHLRVSNGWTALWDGIRIANETLGGHLEPNPQSVGNVRQFCAASRKLAVVAFTDGRDNNSADEQAATYDRNKYPGDGIATTVDDLKNMRADRISTPIYTVGVGRDIDEPSLTALSAATGGRYRRLDDVSQIAEAFSDISEYFGSSHQVCADLPWSVCGDVTLKMEWTWTGNHGTTRSGTRISSVHIPCEVQRGTGRQATIVLTLSNPGIDRAIAGRLAANAVDWVAPRSTPSVLVVLDDGHHGEFVGDAAYVRSLLAERGYNVSLITERAGGLLPSDVAGYDVVWFSNPGYPWNDIRSVDTLVAFLEAGGGVVAQGDDITRSMGNSFSLSRLTHLTFQDNGTSTCNRQTDNNAGDTFDVQFGEGHPLLEGIERATFTYGDDIDLSTPTATGEQILGSASFARGNCRSSRPVLSVFSP